MARSLSLCLFFLVVCAKLSEGRSHIGHGNLVDVGHYANDQHNMKYDHEAFLGKAEKKTFDQLSPEEAKERLGKLVDKMDKNSDGKIVEEELEDWIKAANRKLYEDDTVSHWSHIQRLLLDLHRNKENYKHDTNAPITWDEYVKVTRHEPDSNDTQKVDVYDKQLKKEKRRWEHADTNKDAKLSLQEYVSFLHPQEFGHLKELAVEEEMDAADIDKDGGISLTEFMNRIVPSEDRKAHKDDPEFLRLYEKDFKEHRDKNKDGKMDKAEVLEWLFPTSYDQWKAEAVHMISQADADEDHVLTKQEILDKSDVFVGSRVTSYGRMTHEEL